MLESQRTFGFPRSTTQRWSSSFLSFHGSGYATRTRHYRPSCHLRKTAASVATFFGTGSSLSPEGPSVEVGMTMSRLIMNAFPPMEKPGERLRNANETEMN